MSQIYKSSSSGPAPSSSFTPNTTLQIFDDFLQNNTDVGQLGWITIGSFNAHTVTASNSNPGILQFSDSARSGIFLNGSNAPTMFILGGGLLTNNFVINLIALSTLANRYTVNMGLTDADGGTSTITNGIYFSYSDNVNSGNWVLNCTSAGVTTSVNTSTAATVGYHNYGFTVNAAATSVSFTIDGISVGSAITTNIPTSLINPYLAMIRSSGALPSYVVDLWYLSQTLTAPR